MLIEIAETHLAPPGKRVASVGVRKRQSTAPLRRRRQGRAGAWQGDQRRHGLAHRVPVRRIAVRSASDGDVFRVWNRQTAQ
jgi:hypothetical protein